MRYLRWIATAPLVLIVLSFAISNREEVALSLWPLPFLATVPVFTLALGSFVLGVAVGGLAAWFGGRSARRAVRAEKVRAATAERELAAMRATPAPTVPDASTAAISPARFRAARE